MENKSSSAEFEYIKSLQRQVYFLELEANFLHEQAKKATSLHPRVTSEMEHRLQKLWELQSQSDGLQLELKRRESHLNMQRLERERLSSQIHVTDEHYSKEKQTLLEEIMQLKRQKAQKDQHISAKEMELLHVKQDLEQQKMNLSNSEKAILVLQAKVKQQSEREKVIELQVSEKREELLQLQSIVHAMEEKIFKKTAAMQEHITHELRKEISFLHQQIRQGKLQAEQKYLLRNKMMDDCAVMTKQNATLQAQLLELSKQMDTERALKEESYMSQIGSIAQFLAVKDHKEHLQQEIKRHQELLEQERNTFRELMEQISILENRNTSLDLSVATINSRIAETRAMLCNEEQNNLELKRDKALLVDLISALENKLAGKKTSFPQSSTKMLQLDEAISLLKTRHVLNHLNQKWEEISKMANSMKEFNMSMTAVVDDTGEY